MRRRAIALAMSSVLVAIAGCSSSQGGVAFDSDPTTTASSAGATSSTTATTSTSVFAEGGAISISVDTTAAGADVSPLIRGVSGAPADYLTAVGATLNSWGGNGASTYNYTAGKFWNVGRAGQFRNSAVGSSGDAARDFLGRSAAGGAATRLAVPTLGWVAKDADSCSFRSAGGGCATAEPGSCIEPGALADPNQTSVQSSPLQVAAWVASLAGAGLAPTYVAMDNEPELWGTTHYDLHPRCTTYEEILDRYVANAEAVRALVPDAKLTGPVMCCWYPFWLTAPGPADGQGSKDFLTWFLTNVRAHDDQYGSRTLDVLDLHYYPQSAVLNELTDPDTSALRLRSTRSLWDPSYTDESWIRSTIQLIPRLRETIDQSYPGTAIGISEWNFGADQSMNGALAIADVLGIYGREGVSIAAYSQYPPASSPGFFAFKMHGNYDGSGAAFEGASIPLQSPDVDRLAAFAVLDRGTNTLKVMLLNKQPSEPLDVQLPVTGATVQPARAFTYTGGAAIEPQALGVGGDTVTVTLAASSITVLELALT